MALRRLVSPVLLFLMAVSALPQTALAQDQRAAGGMLGWPRDEMARALGIFVPDRMQHFDVPGVALAIVADGGIVYAGTFGKADRGGDAPVTPGTLFAAGELGQAVTAYGALRMVDDKLLFLDAPLSRDLDRRWLSDDDDNAAITLRNVLTHRSGLGNNVAHPSRHTETKPGTAFEPSGIGFLYLQYVMEQTDVAPFAEIMQARVFKPLGMDGSTFVKSDAAGHEATGYVRLRFLLTIYYVPFALAFVIILAAFWAISWFLFQRRLERIDYVWPLAGAALFAMAIVWWGLGTVSALFVIGAALASAGVVLFLAGFAYYLLYIVGLARARDGIISRGGGGQESVIVGLAGLIALGGFTPALNWSIPVAQLGFLNGAPPANAATSFLTTAPDMGRFMIEVMDGAKLSRETRQRLRTETAPAEGIYDWGLLTGFRRDASGDTLWMRGSVMGFESLMVMDPKRRAGVVILTNSRTGGELAQDIARNVLGIEAVWSVQ
jgi:CubicO group peptidase (beta-lactamase class C family)